MRITISYTPPAPGPVVLRPVDPAPGAPAAAKTAEPDTAQVVCKDSSSVADGEAPDANNYGEDPPGVEDSAEDDDEEETSAVSPVSPARKYRLVFKLKGKRLSESAEPERERSVIDLTTTARPPALHHSGVPLKEWERKLRQQQREEKRLRRLEARATAAAEAAKLSGPDEEVPMEQLFARLAMDRQCDNPETIQTRRVFARRVQDMKLRGDGQAQLLLSLPVLALKKNYCPRAKAHKMTFIDLMRICTAYYP